MLSEVSGTMPDGTPYRIWVSRDPVPGRAVDCVVIAVGDTTVLGVPVATTHNSRVLREIGRAIVQATDWTHEQHQARRDAADLAADVRDERTADAADRGEPPC